MKIIFAGTPVNAATTLSAMLSNEFALGNFEVVGVLTRPDAPIGRKRVITPSPVAQVATAAGIPTIKAQRVNDKVLSEISSLKPDLGLVVAYGALLNETALNALKFGWINIHYSLLPKWRGASPVQSTLLAGEKEAGVTIFQLDQGLDTGPIWASSVTEIQPDETSLELLPRLTALSLPLLAEVLPQIAARTATPTQQPTQSHQLARKFARNDARIKFTSLAPEIERTVRAFNPEPGAWCELRNGSITETFKILRARALGSIDWSRLDDTADFEIGEVRLLNDKVLVVCGSGSLIELHEVQPAGKKPMAAADWYRGTTNAVRLF